MGKVIEEGMTGPGDLVHAFIKKIGILEITQEKKVQDNAYSQVNFSL